MAHDGIKVKKLFAILVVVSFVLLPLISAGFVTPHDDHAQGVVGIDDHCVICAYILVVDNLLRQFGMLLRALPFAIAVLLSVSAALFALSTHFGLQTPVKLKIRIDN